MLNFTFIYKQSGVSYSRTMRVFSRRGFDDPDDLELVGPPVHNYLNGSVAREILGFNKHITLVIPPVDSALDRRFLVQWILASDKTIVYGNYVSQVTNDPKLVSEWVNAVETCRRFTMPLVDEHLYHAWDDGVISDTDMYIKLSVEMSQDATEASPEVFTTNSGKLVVMQNGNPFPAFNSTTHDFYIGVLAADASGATYPAGSISVSGGNLSFSTFPESGYITASSGKLLANVSIWAVAK